MDFDSKLAVSYYNTIADIDAGHGVFLVQHSETKAVRVKKILSIYNADVFKLLKDNPVTGIPQIYELLDEDGTLIVIEDYISGETLEAAVSASGGFDADNTIHIAVGLCDILTRLHSLEPPVIHRDIKPSNVILTPVGEVFLLDLNAARLSDDSKERDTSLLGTKGYAAPEQYGFASSDVRTDIYALGVLMKTILKSEESEPDTDKASGLNAIIDCSNRLDPRDRYSSANELKEALLAIEIDVSDVMLCVIFRLDGQVVGGNYFYLRSSLKASETRAFQSTYADVDSFNSFEVRISEFS